MDHLLYSSNEMFSSTELIRKSKKIFDKLNKNEIEKAIILRDGKPSFMLLNFGVYEKIMKEYLELKSNSQNIKDENLAQEQEEPKIEITGIAEADHIEEEESDLNEIGQEELEKALAEIEELDIVKPIETEDNIDVNESLLSEEKKKKEQPLKEFWE